ncbi:MAG: PQQ-binding-like beta-propeller repeat protein, partial [Saprospiraceae bacterium]|nr:PQQ-binding-like beta-propeller repeat protein [Saprospiraceae bacterium]
MYPKEISLLLFTTFLVLSLTAQDTHWRGEKRDGHYQQKGLLQTWPESGPERILSVEGIGRGFSSIIVANQTIYTTGMIDTMDHLTAVDFSGKVKWQVPYGRSWLNSYPDTRATPTIEGDLIYLVSGTGELVCLDAGDG